MTGALVWWLCQIAVVIAGMCWVTRTVAPFETAAAVLFQARLALEGVVDRLDQLPH